MSAIELKPKCDRAKAIFFLTAGELPSLSGLHASQVLEPALELVRAGYHVRRIQVRGATKMNAVIGG